MKKKVSKFYYGWLTEEVTFLPSINLRWMRTKDQGKIYDIQIAWLFWYFSTNNLGKYLEKTGW